MGRCFCGHHEEDHGEGFVDSACEVDDCECLEFEPVDEGDYDDGEPARDYD